MLAQCVREVKTKNKNLTWWGTPTRIDLRIYDQEWILFLSKIPKFVLRHSNSVLSCNAKAEFVRDHYG